MSIFDTLSGIRNNSDVINKSNASIWKGLENTLTGNLDYQRQLELQEKQQAFNASEAQKTRDWNERLANTAYQRQAKDLKASGFNPALMLSGSGASGYTSATASSSSGSSSGSGASGWSMLAKVGLGLVSQAMNAVSLASKATNSATNALNARQWNYPTFAKLKPVDIKGFNQREFIDWMIGK